MHTNCKPISCVSGLELRALGKQWHQRDPKRETNTVIFFLCCLFACSVFRQGLAMQLWLLGTHYIDQGDFKLTEIPLTLSPKCRD